MKLYYKPGTCSLASHIILRELAIPFTLERTDTVSGLTESGRQYAEVNPKGYVPALELEPGVVLTENPAILEYLADLAKQPQLAPAAGSLQRARLRELLAFLSAELHKTFSPFFSGTALVPEQKQLALQKMQCRLGNLNQQLQQQGPYLLGEQLSVADIYAFVILSWTRYIQVSLADWPALEDFFARIAKRPCVVQAMQAEGLIAKDDQ